MSTLQETVLTLARAVSGAGGQDEVLLETLCRAAEADWRGRLRQGVTAEDCGEAFPCAAAFTAAADLAGGAGRRDRELHGGQRVRQGGAARARPGGRRACGAPPTSGWPRLRSRETLRSKE